jgi:hypothetical protein
MKGSPRADSFGVLVVIRNAKSMSVQHLITLRLARQSDLLRLPALERNTT